MPLAYFGTRISDNMTRTPEGYLICHNVPLARTGWYEYTRAELGLDGDGMVKVYRSPEEVFNPLAMASFEGKTVTDGHPSQYPVTADNEGAYYRGHTQNIRRGAGTFEDCMLGDLFVKDAVLVNKVDNGLREVSCGYDCEWVPQEDGTILQQHIRGNHVAIVPNGRAGDRVSIRDELPKEKTTKRGVCMKFDLKHIFGLGLKEFAKDADPEAVANAFEAAKKAEKEAKDAFPAEGEGGGDNPMMAILQQIQATLQQLVESDKQVHKQVEPEDALDAFEKELEEGKPDKEEKAEDELEGEVPTLSEEETPTNPIPGADSKQAILAGIRAMKPVIASITDATERKKATDALAKSFRDLMGPGSQKTGYGDLLKVRKAQDKKAQDQAAADEEYGKALKNKYHRKHIAGGR